MRITFFDSDLSWQQMLPLSYTRPVADLRIGILKIHEKWSQILQPQEIGFRTASYLNELFPPLNGQEKSLHIFGGLLPSKRTIEALRALKTDEVLVAGEQLLAGYFNTQEDFVIKDQKSISVDNSTIVYHPWDLFKQNGAEIKNDYSLITKNRTSKPMDDSHTIVYGKELFIEEGADIKAAVLNTENGPIYIGKNAQIQEGALIKGPFALGESSVVNMGAKIRGDTTVGPHCKVGGEVSNSLFLGYSNKGHDGFLGNSVIGEWCNLGADTNNSNLKNNYTNVKMWDFASGRFKDTGLQFCGLIMGDHSKCGINTMFNTGTTVGVSANIFGDGFPRNIIPSFAWGGASGFSTYQLKKSVETASLVVRRRSKELTDKDTAMLSHIFEITSNYRVWDNR